MVLIITHEFDYSSHKVIDWLNYFNYEYIKIDYKVPIQIIEMTISNNKINFLLKIRNQIISSDEINKIWYRRSSLNIDNYVFETNLNIEFDQSINNQLLEEKKEIIGYFWDFFKSKSLNTQTDNDLNKFKVLKACVKHDIKIPETIVTTCKKTLRSFIIKRNRIITKNCNPGLLMGYKGYSFSGFTVEVTNEMMDSLSDHFFPTLYQEMIEKSFELRVFYLDGKCYASAIFSQSDDQTMVDFRNYNSDTPNRTPPYKLPNYLEKKLIKLMEDINLNCGSIDLLVDKSGEYYFLEVNPVGQFSQVSFPCNYKLEEKIAKFLIQ